MRERSLQCKRSNTTGGRSKAVLDRSNRWSREYQRADNVSQRSSSYLSAEVVGFQHQGHQGLRSLSGFRNMSIASHQAERQNMQRRNERDAMAQTATSSHQRQQQPPPHAISSY